jgi:hypothetical protein
VNNMHVNNPLPPCDVEKCIIPTQQLMGAWRSKMASLSACDYDDGELGACLTQAFLDVNTLDRELSVCVDHFANRYDGMDEIIARGAMVELVEGFKLLFAQLPLRTPNGQFPFLFMDWLEDDMVLARLPY